MKKNLRIKIQLIAVCLFCLATGAGAQTSLSYTTPNAFVKSATINPLSPVINPPIIPPGTVFTLGNGFNRPYSIAKDTMGNIYVADFGSGTVKKIAVDGSTTVLAPGLNGPSGVAVDAAGNVYVCANGDNQIYKVAPDGSGFNSLGAGFNNPWNITVDAAGYIYVSDVGSGTIKKIAPDGITVTTVGPEFNIPRGITTDAAGNIYVAEEGGGAVYRMDRDGSAVTLLGSGFNLPFGITLDAAGNVYVADYANDGVKKIAVDGTITSIGSGLGHPVGIATDANGNILVGGQDETVIKKIMGEEQAVVKYSINPALPAGLSIDSATGVISGTPLAASAAIAYTVTAVKPVGNQHAEAIVTISVAPSSITHAIVCSSELPYTWNETDYNAPGSYAVHLTNDAGEDSAAVLVLTVLQATTSSTTVSLYSYQLPFNWNGTDYTIPGTYTFTTTNTAGCDSTATLVLKVTSVQPPPVNFTYHTPNVFVKNRSISAVAPVLSPQPLPVGTVTAIGSGFNQPRGIATDPAGNVYVADYANHVIKKTTPAGVTTVFGPGFNTPTGVASDAGGNIYVSDELANTIYKLAPNGSVLNSIGPRFGSFGILIGYYFSHPYDVAVDAGGNIYVADLANNVIKKILPDWATVTTVGSGFSTPSGVATDASGNVYVADYGNNAVKMIAPNGVTSTLGAGFTHPFDVVADATGNVYVTNMGDSTVKKITAGGTVANAAASFIAPTGITTDAGGNVYVADAASNTVKEIIVFGQQVSKFTINPQLPPGLGFDTLTGVISGTPLRGSSSKTYTVTAIRTAGNITTPVKIAINVFDTVSVSICPTGLPYNWNGVNYNTAGNYTTHLIVPGESDSAITLLLTVKQATASTTPVTICRQSLPYHWNGTDYNAAGSYTIHLTNAAGCDSATTLVLRVNEPTTSNTAVSVCSYSLPYNWNGADYTAAGSYTIHLTNATGCDSAATLVLTVNEPTTSSTPVSICRADLPYNWNGTDYNAAGSYTVHLTNANGCDSAATLVLTVNEPTASSTPVSVCQADLPYNWNGTDYNAAGSYTTHLTNAMGCDSTATLVLTVNETTASSTPVSICVSDLPYHWNGIDYSEAGSYTIHLTNAGGCDSAATLVLTVNEPTASSTSVTICSSDLPFNWNGIDYTTTGSYTIHLANIAGCDSAATLVLTVNESTASSTPVTICSSALPYNWNGTDYNAAGSYTIHLTNAAGCDSATTLVLTVNEPTTSTTSASACAADLPYHWNGSDYNAAGSYTIHLTNSAGCDSAATLVLSVNEPTTSSTPVTVCSTDLPYQWNGVDYSTTGSYTIHLINEGGCDSAVTLVLTVIQATTSNTPVTVCSTDLPYTWNGVEYNAAGSYTTHLANVAGCDSAATLVLTVNQSTTSTTSVTVYANQLPYYWNGTGYTASGSYTVHLTNAAGCDSAATLLFTADQSSVSSTVVNICSTSLPYHWNGTNYNSPGTYTIHLTNSGGFDSAATLVLIVNQSTSSVTYATICSSAIPYVWNGTKYTATGSYTIHLANAAGCDSAATLVLTINLATASTTTILLYPVQLPFSWNGTSYSNAGTYTFTTTNAAGCDSVATLVLEVNDNFEYSTPNVFGIGTAINPLLPVFPPKSTVGGKSFTIFSGSFTQPQGLATDAAGNVYVADMGNSRVEKISGNLSILSVLGKGFKSPVSVAVDAAGNVYVADAGNGLVEKISGIDGKTTTAIGSGFKNPTGVAADAAGNVYVADGSSIKKIAPDGINVTTVIPGISPVAIAADAAGNVYFADQGDNTVKKIKAGSSIVTTLVSGFSGISGISVDAADNIYVAFNKTGEIKMIAPDGSTVTTIGSGFSSPAGVAASVWGNVNVFVSSSKDVLEIAAVTQKVNGYSISPALPAGLGIDAATGIISGTPTVRSTATTYTVTAAIGTSNNTALVQISVTGADTTSVSVCATDLPYHWNGADYSVAGSYIVHLVSSTGADSLVELLLTVKQPTVSSTAVTTSSDNLPYNWNGTAYTASGSYTIHLTNAAGCDSAATLVLTVKPPHYSLTTVSVCSASLPYIWNGTSFNASGNYTVAIPIAPGVDSLPELDLTVNQPTSSSTAITVCSSAMPYHWNGHDYAAAGSYTIHLANAASCDSIATLVLTVAQPGYSTSSVTVFTNQLPYFWDGQLITSAGTYSFTAPGSNYQGCDSVETLILTVRPVPTTELSYNTPNVFEKNTTIQALTPFFLQPLLPQGSVTSVGTGGIINPASIATDAPGNLYVIDAVGGSVKKISSNGLTTTTVGSGFGSPSGIAVDGAGNIYVADGLFGNINKIMPDGTMSTLRSGLLNPGSIAVDGLGNVYVLEGFTNVIDKITPDGSTLTHITTDLIFISSLTIDVSGNIYASGQGSTVIEKIAPDGKRTPITTDFFTIPVCLTTDAQGNIYAGLPFSSLIKIASDGTSTSLGPIFFNPTGIATDAMGNVYVATDGTIEKITGPGQLVNSYSIDPPLPAGLTIDAVTGIISGTPSVQSAQTTYTVTAARDAGNLTAPVDITVNGLVVDTTAVTVCVSSLPYHWNGTDYNAAGFYTAHLTNSAGNDSTAVLSLTLNPAITSATLASTGNVDSVCYGKSVSLHAAAKGGVKPYLFSIDSGRTYITSNTFLKPAGAYAVKIKDANGCTSVTNSITISQPAVKLTATALQVNNTDINVTATGGFGGYLYSINGGTYQSPNVFTGITPGTDTIAVKDKIGCIVQVRVVPALSGTLAVKGDSMVCYKANGTILVTATGNNKPLLYSIDTGKTYQLSRTFIVPAGSYAVTVKDTAGNTFTTNSVTIKQPVARLSIGYTTVNSSCIGSSDGAITVHGVGGFSAYAYTYSIGGGTYSSANTFVNLTAGIYALSVKDTGGCIANKSITIKQPTKPCSSFSAPTYPTSNTAEMADELKIKIYPNPAPIEFNLQVVSGDSKEVVELRVMDMLGKTIYQTRGSVYDMYKFGRTFASGIYIAEVLNGNSVQRVKLVKGN